MRPGGNFFIAICNKHLHIDVYKSMKRLIISLIAVFTVIGAFAQSQTANNVSESGYGLVKTNLNVEYEHSWGQIRDEFEARASYEFLKKKAFTLSANLRYNSFSADFDDDALTNGFKPDEIGLNKVHIMGHAGITAAAHTRLFGKPLVGVGIVNTGFNHYGFDRVQGIIMGMVMLRANRDTQFGVGLLALINTTSRIPAFPVFMYRHRFNPQWALNLYGTLFGVDYNPTPNVLLSAGADIDVKSFIFKPHHENLPSTGRYTLTSCRPLLRYRQRLAKNFYLEAKSGVALKMSARMNGRTGTHAYFKSRQKAAPFVQIGLAYAL